MRSKSHSPTGLCTRCGRHHWQGQLCATLSSAPLAHDVPGTHRPRPFLPVLDVSRPQPSKHVYLSELDHPAGEQRKANRQERVQRAQTGMTQLGGRPCLGLDFGYRTLSDCPRVQLGSLGFGRLGSTPPSFHRLHHLVQFQNSSVPSPVTSKVFERWH